MEKVKEKSLSEKISENVDKIFYSLGRLAGKTVKGYKDIMKEDK